MNKNRPSQRKKKRKKENEKALKCYSKTLMLWQWGRATSQDCKYINNCLFTQPALASKLYQFTATFTNNVSLLPLTLPPTNLHRVIFSVRLFVIRSAIMNLTGILGRRAPRHAGQGIRHIGPHCPARAKAYNGQFYDYYCNKDQIPLVRYIMISTHTFIISGKIRVIRTGDLFLTYQWKGSESIVKSTSELIYKYHIE